MHWWWCVLPQAGRHCHIRPVSGKVYSHSLVPIWGPTPSHLFKNPPVFPMKLKMPHPSHQLPPTSFRSISALSLSPFPTSQPLWCWLWALHSPRTSARSQLPPSRWKGVQPPRYSPPSSTGFFFPSISEHAFLRSRNSPELFSKLFGVCSLLSDSYPWTPALSGRGLLTPWS